MTNSLGSTLREARELISLTLRQVEEATGISNAYLSQLENDKIKKPSANVLYKLASIYRVDMNSLLRATGIIKKSDEGIKSVSDEFSNSIAFYAKDLSEDERQEVLDFLKFKFQKLKRMDA